MTLPPGFRFHPTDEELVAYYLKRRVNNHPIDFDVIADVDLYKCEPDDLPSKSRLPGIDLEWFFFSPRDRKYPNGSRTNRATKTGYWKATGRDRYIKTGGVKIIGMKKTLVFYRGRAPQGVRSDWLMHEYRLDGNEMDSNSSSHVLCRVFRKSSPDAMKRSKVEAVDDVADSAGTPPQSPNVGNPQSLGGVNQQVFEEADVKPILDSPATPPLYSRQPMQQQQQQQQNFMDLQQQQDILDQQQPGHLEILQVLDDLPPVQPINDFGEFEKFDPATLADLSWLDPSYYPNAPLIPTYPENTKTEFKDLWSQKAYGTDGLVSIGLDTSGQFGNYNFHNELMLPSLVQSPSPPPDSTPSQECYVLDTPDASNIVIRPRALNNSSPTTGLRTTARQNIKFQRYKGPRSVSSPVSDEGQDDTNSKSPAAEENRNEDLSPKMKEPEPLNLPAADKGADQGPTQDLSPSQEEKRFALDVESEHDATDDDEEEEEVDSEVRNVAEKEAKAGDLELVKEKHDNHTPAIVDDSEDLVKDCALEAVKQKSLTKLAKLLGSLRVQLTALLASSDGNLKTVKLPPSIGAIHLNAVVYCSCEKGNGRSHVQKNDCQCYGKPGSLRRGIPSEAAEGTSEESLANSGEQRRALRPRRELVLVFFMGIFTTLVGIPLLERMWKLFQEKHISV